MKDPVQKKETSAPVQQQQQAEGQQSGGNTMSPPSFQLKSSPAQMKTDPSAPKKKDMTPQEAFVAKYAKSAVALENKDGVPALFTLAQGALESAWGEKAIGNALFGIKAGKGWEGKKQLVTTTEYLSDDKQGHRFPEVLSITKVTEGKNAGKYKYMVKDWFRDYDTVEEGLADHGSFLHENKRYAGAFNTTTPEDFAQAVADAGYATAKGYGQTLKDMIASVKKRWPSDVPMPAGNAKAKTGGKPGGATTEPGKDKPGTTPTTKPGGQTTGKPKETPVTTGAKTIKASVGDGGVNNAEDSLVIKELMIKAGYDLTMIPAIGPKTIGYIKDFQTKKFGWSNPDGLIEPGGTTFKALLAGVSPTAKPTTKPETKPSTKPEAKPSGPSTDYNTMSAKLYEAMYGGFFGLGTDEDAIYAELTKLGKDSTKISALKARYKAKYGRDLAADLRDEMSGSELSRALDLITPKAAPASPGNTGSTSKPSTPAPKPETSSKDTSGKSTLGKEDPTKGDSVTARLDKFYSDFSNIQVTHGDKTISVKPPYHINAFKRGPAAIAARNANPKVKSFLDGLKGKITSNALVGKAQPSDLKIILEGAVNQGLVTHEAKAMHDFLAKYGLSTDCSGYVSQALNFLMDGNEVQDSKDGLKPGGRNAASMKGGTDDFTKVAITDVKPGDTMHLDGHIRIINEVVNDGGVLFFRTAESASSVNAKNGMNGLTTRWWKYEGGKKYNTWENYNKEHPSAADKNWKQSNESNTFGRYKKLAAS